MQQVGASAKRQRPLVYVIIQLTVDEDASGDRVTHVLAIYETECLNEEWLNVNSCPAYNQCYQQGHRSSRSSCPVPHISSCKSCQSGVLGRRGRGVTQAWRQWEQDRGALIPPRNQPQQVAEQLAIRWELYNLPLPLHCSLFGHAKVTHARAKWLVSGAWQNGLQAILSA
jgi:hypothetical protein